MDIECEMLYNKVIENVCERMEKSMNPELLKKISTMWKRGMILSRAKVQRKVKKTEPEGSDEEYILPETKNVCFGTLEKFYKKEPYWRVKIKSGMLKLENSAEYIIPVAKARIKSDFF